MELTVIFRGEILPSFTLCCLRNMMPSFASLADLSHPIWFPAIVMCSSLAQIRRNHGCYDSKFTIRLLCAVGAILHPSVTTGVAPTEAREELLESRGTGRIVGGNDVDPPGKYPFMLFQWIGKLDQENQPEEYTRFCGATIVDKHWAVSAAHCDPGMFTRPPTPYTKGVYLIAGAHNEYKLEPWSQNVSVVEIIPHPRYDARGSRLHDIALLRVEPPFIFNSKVSPVNLPVCDFDIEEDAKVQGRAIGWGTQYKPWPPSPTPHPPHKPILQEVELPLLTTGSCQHLYGHVPSETDPNWYQSIVITDYQICAGIPNGGKDACFGDSGGPLLLHHPGDNTYTLIGISSFGLHCGYTHPGVFTRVSQYVSWIKYEISRCKSQFYYNITTRNPKV